jgi:hypothetical protein
VYCCGLDSTGPAYCPVVNCCERANENLGSIHAEEFVD